MVLSPDGRLPCVVYCHCNSGSRRDAEEVLYHLLPRGMTVFALDFAVGGWVGVCVGGGGGAGGGKWVWSGGGGGRVGGGGWRVRAWRGGGGGKPGSRCERREVLLPPHLIDSPTYPPTHPLQGSGLSEGDYVTLGANEVDDLAAAVAYLRWVGGGEGWGGERRAQQPPPPCHPGPPAPQLTPTYPPTCLHACREEGSTSAIGLWGRSMGAVTALMYAQRDPTVAGLVGGWVGGWVGVGGGLK